MGIESSYRRAIALAVVAWLIHENENCEAGTVG